MLAVQVWRWLGAVALLLFTPFAAFAALVSGSNPSTRRRKGSPAEPVHIPLGRRVIRTARGGSAAVVALVGFALVSPLLFATGIAFVITVADKKLSQIVSHRVRNNRLWVRRGLNAGLYMYELAGIRISRKVRKEQRRRWSGNIANRAIREIEVPFSGVVGLGFVIAAFVLELGLSWRFLPFL